MLRELKPLKRRPAIAVAIGGMWLLGMIGNYMVIHSESGWFIRLGGFDATTMMQLGAFYLAWTGGQIPAACFVGAVIVCSTFTKPLRTTFWIVTSYHLVFSVIRAIRWPWIKLPDLNQFIPILAYLASILILVGVSVLFAWFTQRYHKFFQRYHPDEAA